MDNYVLQLSQILGYTFKNTKLLRAALTHRSISTTNNERLEFLGDSILNFTIAAELYQRFPKAHEGDLTRMRAMLVKGETVAKIGIELGIGQFLNLGVGEQKSGGHQRQSIISDALEAIIGAIYLDAGFENCRTCLLKWYASRLNSMVFGVTQKDPKTELQEYLQAKGLPLPEYQVLEVKGDQHNPIFQIQCKVVLLPHLVLGIAGSRRGAEQNSAAAVLNDLKNNG